MISRRWHYSTSFWLLLLDRAESLLKLGTRIFKREKYFHLYLLCQKSHVEPLLCQPPLTPLRSSEPTFRNMDESGFLVCYAEALVFGCGCSNSSKFKWREKQNDSRLHDVDITPLFCWNFCNMNIVSFYFVPSVL